MIQPTNEEGSGGDRSGAVFFAEISFNVKKDSLTAVSLASLQVALSRLILKEHERLSAQPDCLRGMSGRATFESANDRHDTRRKENTWQKAGWPASFTEPNEAPSLRNKFIEYF